MNFNNNLPEWKNEGTEPSDSLKNGGFSGGYKPPASVFNWFWSKVIKAITELQTLLKGHAESTSNPHGVTKSQVGLGNVDNTADANKPVSTAMQTALNNKVDKVSGKGLSTNDYTAAEKTKLAGIRDKAVGEKYNALDGEIFNSYTGVPRNIASGMYSHAEGSYTKATGISSHAEGEHTQATGNCAHAEGSYTSALWAHSHAEGEGTSANQQHSHAEGYYTVASGLASHAEGEHTQATGDCAHAEGSCETLKEDETAEGYGATGSYSHAEGKETWASGLYSHAEGNYTSASGPASHAEGELTTAAGEASHAGGYSVIANAFQCVVGKNNAVKDGCVNSDSQREADTIFIVGNGTSLGGSNAFRITADGKCRGSSAFAASGADYARLYEWKDGNPNTEDRRGLFVVLDGDKIRIATAEDDLRDCEGIVSANPAFVENAPDMWHGMYVKDVFGGRVTETVEVEGKTVTRYKVNPDYDPDEEYTTRETRKEWSAVGFSGFIIAVDDGTCEVNGYCTVGAGGKATKSDSWTQYKVMERKDETHIKLRIK